MASTQVQVIITAQDQATSIINGIGNSFQSSAGAISNGAQTASLATEGLNSNIGMMAVQMEATRVGAIVAGVAILALAAAMIKVSANAVGAASDFQSAMVMIQTNAGASTDEVQKMSTAVLGLAGQVGQSPLVLAQGLFFVESAGYRGATALNILTIAAKGAAIGHANLTDTTKVLTSVISSGIKGAGDYSQAMGTLNAIVGNGKITMDDLNSALSTGVLASAKTAGVSIQQLGAAIDTLVNSGMNATDASSRLNTMLQKMMDITPQGTKALAQLGLTQKQVFNDMQSGGIQKVLADFNAGLQTAGTGAEVLTSKSKLTGAQTKLLGDSISQATAKLTQMKDAHVKGADAIAVHNAKIAVAQDRLDAMKGKLDGASSSLVTVGGHALDAADKAKLLGEIFGVRESAAFESLIQGSDQFNTRLKGITKGAQDFKANWEATEATNKAATDKMNAAVGTLAIKWGNVLLPAVTAVENFMAATLLPALSAVADFIGKHQTAVAILAGLFSGVLLFALIAVGAALWALVAPMVILGVSAAIAFLPFILITAVVVTAIILIAQHFKEIQKVIGEVGATIGTLYHIFIDFFTGGDITLKKNEAGWAGFVISLMKFRDGAIGVFTTVKNAIETAFTTVGNSVTAAIRAFGTFGTWVTTSFHATVNSIGNFFTTTWHNATQAFNNFLKWVVSTFGPAFKTAVFALSLPGIIVHDVFVLAFYGIQVALQRFGTYLSQTFGPIISTVMDAIKGFLQMEAQGWKNVWDTIVLLLQKFGSWIQQTFTAILNTTFTVIRNLLHAAQQVWTTIWDTITSLLQRFGSWLNATFSPGINATFTGIQALLTTLSNFFTTIWNGITGLLTRFGDWISKTFTGILDASFKWIHTALDGLYNGWVKIWNNIATFVEGIASRVLSTVKSMINNIIGFFNNIISGANKVGSKVPGYISIPNIPQFQTGGVVPGPIGAPALILAHGGETVVPQGISSPGGISGNGSGQVIFNVNIGLYTGTETEQRNIAKKLYGSLLQLAQSQHKSVSQYMGG